MQIPKSFQVGVVTQKLSWTDSLFSIRIKVDSHPFVPGQFTKLALVNDEDELVRRAYSIVNSPADFEKTNELEFVIVTDLDGKLSPQLHLLEEGDDVYVGLEGAGFMVPDEIPDTASELWLLSTGTGLGPFISMITEPGFVEKYQKIVLVHAARLGADLTYKTLIEELAQQYPQISYVPVVSREDVDGAMSGRIPELLANRQLESELDLNLDFEKSFIYLCGNPGMVREGIKVLQERGYHKHLRRKAGHFACENYW
ncbi:ferredoxin-NADP(+) reductase [Vibrio ishigakensis]|uniref:ferredoxin--NADP(+) reductase n=1 Tax=Vibrio ishigakensis TaxID=1481914 RepID=A0A0B8P0K6_9VIBR|nr:ferredoxin--NADP reductase [Vibrio ishigakensis]GAM58112.1 ferredoxin-NADP(+) reductase [Vibrio ishigakensis]